MHKVIKIYDSIKLHLGLKKALRTHLLTEANLIWLDQHLFYPLSQLLSQYFYLRIVDRYGAEYHWGDQKSQNLDLAHYNFGYGEIHYALIRSQRPKRVLCIGSMYGFIPYLMAYACRDNGWGQVDFVDAGYDMNKRDKHYYGQGFWKKIDPKKHFDYLGVAPFLRTYVLTSAQFARKYHEQYDYIYFDGDHSYPGARENLRLFWPRLRQEGFLCLHDIHFDRLIAGVRFEHGKIWKDLSFLPYKFELSNHYSGLGFIQKLGVRISLGETKNGLDKKGFGFPENKVAP